MYLMLALQLVSSCYKLWWNNVLNSIPLVAFVRTDHWNVTYLCISDMIVKAQGVPNAIYLYLKIKNGPISSSSIYVYSILLFFLKFYLFFISEISVHCIQKWRNWVIFGIMTDRLTDRRTRGLIGLHTQLLNEYRMRTYVEKEIKRDIDGQWSKNYHCSNIKQEVKVQLPNINQKRGNPEFYP